MPFAISELQGAYQAYQRFLAGRPASPHHARYIFPFFAGSYFAYRRIDVLRTVAVARAASSSGSPRYVDFGCGYGDFLSKVREYLPDATGVEKEAGIFYAVMTPRPAYIQAAPAESFAGQVDTAFVGWMEPGQDYRRHVARAAKCVITTFDAGGQCGINGGCEYDEFGFERVAWWRTPSWIDVNAELMNRYYTPSLGEEEKQRLSALRSAHNFWHVYARPEISGQVRKGLEAHLEGESSGGHGGGYDFESVLDECGFRYSEELPALTTGRVLWEVRFD